MECYDGLEFLLLNVYNLCIARGREKHLFLPVPSRIFIHVITCLCSLILSLFLFYLSQLSLFLSLSLALSLTPSFILGVKCSVCFIFFHYTIGREKKKLGHRYYLFLFCFFCSFSNIGTEFRHLFSRDNTVGDFHHCPNMRKGCKCTFFYVKTIRYAIYANFPNKQQQHNTFVRSLLHWKWSSTPLFLINMLGLAFGLIESTSKSQMVISKMLLLLLAAMLGTIVDCMIVAVACSARHRCVEIYWIDVHWNENRTRSARIT